MVDARRSGRTARGASAKLASTSRARAHCVNFIHELQAYRSRMPGLEDLQRKPESWRCLSKYSHDQIRIRIKTASPEPPSPQSLVCKWGYFVASHDLRTSSPGPFSMTIPPLRGQSTYALDSELCPAWQWKRVESQTTLLYIVLHPPPLPSQHQLLPRGHLRVLRDYCSL